MRFVFISFCLIFFYSTLNAQQIIGTSGLLNTPSAHLRADGSFMLGGNYLPEAITHESFDYNTANYFFDLTFLPFAEISYKLTIFEAKKDQSIEQDRSLAFRLQLLKERKYWPAIVVGGNDMLTTNMGGTGNQYFGSAFVVASKKVPWLGHEWLLSLGYSSDVFNRDQPEGVFAGIGFSPSFLPQATAIFEYDGEVYNAGVNALIIKHISITAFFYDLKYFTGGVAYQFTIKQ